MGFDIQDGKEYLPPEEDIYDVNDIEEREAFESLLGLSPSTQDQRLKRRRIILVVVAVFLVIAFGVAFYSGLFGR